jgi:serine protease Do
MDFFKKIISLLTGMCLVVAGFACYFAWNSRHAVTQLQEFAERIDASSSKQPLSGVPQAAVLKNGTSWLNVQKQVKDTVVQVFSQASEFNWLEPYKTPDQNEGVGSGFFINDEGDVVTNYHVVAQAGSVQIQIPSFGMERFDVEIVGVSPERDIALLQLTQDAKDKIKQTLNTIPFLELGDSDEVLRSQEVLALGYPLGQTRLKSTLGIVSGRERLGYFGYIQITAPLNPGNSGGPTLNNEGRVIGINNRGILEAQSVGYIIPINEVKSALLDLYKVRLLRKPMLGCIFTVSTPEMVQYLGNPGSGGWYIAKVFENTILKEAGVKEDDMLYEVNGHRLDMYGEINVPWSEDKVSLFELLNRATIGDTINFVIYRKGTRKEFNFKLENKYLPPVRHAYPEFESEATDFEVIGGMVVMQMTLNHIGMLLSRSPDLVRFGRPENQYQPAVIVTHVQPNSQAYKARVIRPGEIIEELNGQPIKTLADFRAAALKSKETRYLTIRTVDKLYAVLSLDKILKEEAMLTKRYFSTKTALCRELEGLPQEETDKK